MNDDTILSSALGQLGQTAKQVVKQIVKIPEEMAKDAGGQVGGVKPTEQKPEAQKSDWKSDEERVKFLRDLYGSSQPSREASTSANASGDKTAGKAKQPADQNSANPLTSTVENKKPTEFEEQIADKSPEEQKKLMELRSQLHKENYYDPTFNQPKNPPAGKEERPAEKVEKEKQMEDLELEQKEKNKPPPLAVVRERNKAEQFRGASG